MDNRPSLTTAAAVHLALARAADLAATTEEQYNLAKSFLKFEPEALALLNQQRLLVLHTVPGVH